MSGFLLIFWRPNSCRGQASINQAPKDSMYGYVWLCMAMYGYVWVYMAMYGLYGYVGMYYTKCYSYVTLLYCTVI